MILDYFLAQSPYPKHEESEEQKVIDTNLSTHILLMIQLDPDFHTRLFPLATCGCFGVGGGLVWQCDAGPGFHPRVQDMVFPLGV